MFSSSIEQHRHLSQHMGRRACRFRNKLLIVSLLLFISLLPPSTLARKHILLTEEDLEFDEPSSIDDQDSSSTEWDEFSDKTEGELDPGSWRPIFEPDSSSFTNTNLEDEYYSGVRKLISAVSSDDLELINEAASEIEVAAANGNPHAQSVLGFLFGTGQLREKSEAKAFLYHQFASEGGNMQSKMALAYTYHRQNMHEEAVKLYAELAEAALSSFLISKDTVIEDVRIHSGIEENTAGLRKYRGDNDEEFQAAEFQAQRGSAEAMYRLALYYYYGFRGVGRNHTKAMSWLSKAAEKGEPGAMELLGEIYARGDVVERDYAKAFKWLTLASTKQHFSAYNGMGYLHVKGYGAEKNDIKAREYFKKAAENKDVSGHYNLGMLCLKGIGVKKNVTTARNFFIIAANVGHPKAIFQLAKMSHKGEGLKKNLHMATELYRTVAERGPWSSLSRWALESYLKGEVGKAFLLYLRLAELGYEVAQSNAAWILDKYGERCMCMGGFGFCTDTERHQRAHALWWQASEQGNVHAALLIGDAYYYGRGTESDYERAAEAYMHAKAQSNAQAMFNLGYMYEHGHGLPFDLHLAKRYYDQALENDPAAKLPVTLALMSLWIRKNYANSFMVNVIDSLPEVQKNVEAWVGNVILDEGNATILTLFACLLTVLYLRQRQRRHAAAVEIAHGPQLDVHNIVAPN